MLRASVFVFETTFIGFVVSVVLWFPRFLGVNGFIVSGVPWFDRFRGVNGFMVSWFLRFHSFMCFVIS